MDGIGEFLHSVGVFRDVAFFGHKYRVGEFAAFLAEGGDDVAFSFLFNHSCLGLKQLDIISCSGGEGRGNIGEIHILDQIQILLGIDALLLKRKFTSHLRHAALALPEEGDPFERAPVEVRYRLAGNQEGPVRLGQLGKVDQRVIRPLVADIDSGFRSNQRHINLTGQKCCGDLIPTGDGLELHLQPLLLEEALGQSHILRRIKNGPGHLCQPHSG
ncbi:hypothetical protein D3C71_1583080 [compost metagenome]